MKTKAALKVIAVIILLECAAGMLACQLGSANASEKDLADPQAATAPQADSGIVIENDSELPDTYPSAQYEVRFRAHGGVSLLHWRLEKGALPPGIKLEDNGLLHGQAQRLGEFQLTVSVTDGTNQLTKAFVIRVRSALTLNWKAPDDMDLTFIAMAIASNGRATAIGYQHFLLPRNTIAKELPFGENLPHGGYVVHFDAVGEVGPKNLIYRANMQTPLALQVTVGP